MKVILKTEAENSLMAIADFIEIVIRMPETADRYTDKLLDFAQQLSNTPNAYSICKFPIWKEQQLLCATFDKTWDFAFKVIKNKLVIFHIVNGKLLNY